MGAVCLKEKQKPQRRTPIHHKDSNVEFLSSNMMGTAYSGGSCPIENLDILDKKAEIDKSFPFSSFSQIKTTQDLREPIWRRINFPSESQGKHWFFSNEKVSKAHGYGVLYFFGKYAEYTVQGEFQNNSIFQHEAYIKIFKEGSAYMGNLNKNFQPHGKGELHYANHSKYIGQFKNGLPDGEGEEITKSYKFVGTFEKGEKVKGKMEEMHGNYEGEFKNNMKEGQGEQVLENGMKYVGQFSKNKKHGYGELSDPSGKIIFQGMWKHNQKVKQ